MDKVHQVARLLGAERRSQSVDYEKLDQRDEGGDGSRTSSSTSSSTTTPSQDRRRWKSQLIAHISSFSLGLLTMTLAIAACQTLLPSLAPSSSSSPSSSPGDRINRPFPEQREGNDPDTKLPLAWYNGDCGSTSAEAIANNCVYSIVLHSWLPPSCLTPEDREDEELMYAGREDAWSYTLDNGTALTMEDLKRGDYHHFTTSFGWHVVHCMYVWKRVHRVAMDAEKRMDSYTANYHHTEHCVKMIGGDPGGMKDSGTKIFVKYPVCA